MTETLLVVLLALGFLGFAIWDAIEARHGDWDAEAFKRWATKRRTW